MKDIFGQLSPYMNNLPGADWLHQIYSRINWQIVQQFTTSTNSRLNKNWSSELPSKADGPGTKDFASSPFLNWDQQTNLFSRVGLEIIWSERQNVIEPLTSLAEYGLLAMMFLFFLFALSVCAWQIYRYIGFIKEALLYEEVTWFFALQTFFTLSPFLTALLSAGIYGLKCIFFVFSLIGFALAVIFTIDLAARSETENSNSYSMRKMSRKMK